MKAKNLAQLSVAIIFAIGLIVLTGMKIMPTEVLAGFVGVAITWVFEEKRREKEIARLIASLKK